MMIKAILIANTAEAFKEILGKDSHTRRGKERINHELTLSQRAFFWESDNKIVVTPYPIPSVLLEANKRALGFGNVVNLAPTSGSVNLCSSVLGDRKLLRLIAGEIRKSRCVAVSPYAVTQDFLQLVAGLKGLGLQFVVEEKPADASLWIVSYLDSKAGFRTEMLKLRSEHVEVKVPEGFVAQNVAEAQRMAEWFYKSGRSLVLKANFGESGWGIKIIREEEYTSLPAFRKAFATILKNDVIWQNTSIVVEEFVDPDTEVAGGSPSTEMLVTEQGALFLYHCGQVVNDAGAFFGVEIGRGALSNSLSRKLLVIGNIIGKRYWELGYRGYFDIDFIISKTGEIFVAETNTRRTGGTHVYDAARHLFGGEYEKEAYLLSHDSFLYHRKRMLPEELLEKLKVILYPIKGEKKGVIITLISEWSPVLGYIIIASNRSEGQKMQRRLLSIFDR
ncbi:MAG: hypothetical protein Q7S84_03165 [bacterium]|nr:hypothetical protein [bacterium]